MKLFSSVSFYKSDLVLTVFKWGFTGFDAMLSRLTSGPFARENVDLNILASRHFCRSKFFNEPVRSLGPFMELIIVRLRTWKDSYPCDLSCLILLPRILLVPAAAMPIFDVLMLSVFIKSPFPPPATLTDFINDLS